MDEWGDAARRVAQQDRRTPEEIARAIRRDLDYLNVLWPVDAFLNGGVVADLARDALALLIAGGGDAAALLESCERLPVIGDGSPTVAERGRRAGTQWERSGGDAERWHVFASAVFAPADAPAPAEGHARTPADAPTGAPADSSAEGHAAGPASGHEHTWPNAYTSCTCGEAHPYREPDGTARSGSTRRFGGATFRGPVPGPSDAFADPAFLDAEYTDDD